jgi:predicted glycogen debranching enzyme
MRILSLRNTGELDMDFLYQKNAGISLEEALSIEWLETNGLGDYASSTSINCHTRKYHGLLVSKLDNLPNKYVLFSKLEDVLIQDGRENFLTAHSYPNFLQDGSFANLQEFVFTTNPSWRFQFGNLILTKEILLLYEEKTVLFKYKISGGNKHTKIKLCPLLACRDFHKLQHENSSFRQEIKKLSMGFSSASYTGMPVLFFQTNAKHHYFLSQPLWYRNFIYTQEKDRGYDFQEDLFLPGVITFSDLDVDSEIIFSCSLVEQPKTLELKWQQEMQRRTKNITETSGSILQRQLKTTGRSFITKDLAKLSSAVVAGYHWFLEWGRDTMISLPGLTLYSGQENLCLEILKTFAQHEQQGLIPNYLGKTKEENAYNSVDASLWFAWAIQQYYLKTKNLKAIATYFWPTLKNIFTFYKLGTLHHIKMQADGLLFAGSPEVNLTWMDAVVRGKPVTPRYGLQVEVNALWFNMLAFMDELATLLADPTLGELKIILPSIKTSFLKTFWCEEKRYLYDFVNAEEKNSALRPNQIFAISLPYSPLLINIAVSVVVAVKDNLLTPYGLRTLAPNEAGYIGFYNGDQTTRDLAYHNGAVWPWLLGAFVESLLKTTSDRRKVLEIIKPCLAALQKHLAEYGIGSIAEIFSGNHPHQPNGCISQAWSVAEILRLTYMLGLDK